MIYDCFLFFNEFEVLEIRLNELDPFVDRFVLVECTQTHRGKEKPLHFANYLVSSIRHGYPQIERFLNKITHIIVDDPPKINIDDGRLRTREAMDWSIENFQRNCVMRGLEGCTDEDIILISDVDELPRGDVLKDASFIGTDFYTMVQRLYYYHLNTYVENSWGGTTVVKYGTLKNQSPQYFRDNKKRGRRLRSHVCDTGMGDSGGWHFSYIGGISKMQEKIRSFAHWEVDLESINNAAFLQKCIDEMKIFHKYNRGYSQLVMEKITFLPKYVQDNQERFKEFFK